jgi:hypothetical protein
VFRNATPDVEDAGMTPVAAQQSLFGDISPKSFATPDHAPDRVIPTSMNTI